MIVRGGGDLATGVIQKLWHVGFKILVLETECPLAIRRTVSVCDAIFQKEQRVEDLVAVRITSLKDCTKCWQQNKLPVFVDQTASAIQQLKPLIVIDAILAKKNLGTHRGMAPITIALGPGFSAPQDVDVVIETMRGHRLGRLYFEGTALPNTGIPGEIGGKSAERVVHAPASGQVIHLKNIGDLVLKGEALFLIDQVPVYSPLTGTLRGLISEKVTCYQGLKCADVDPRPVEKVDCLTISDKARALGGAVLEAIFMIGRRKNVL
ncbi:molybdenum hydroxylase [Enterococcus faecalis]|nr:EF2563 family selenium-dependent molybdenum hydroxylase system protein [Enterococcus faecalis]PQD60898.1 molybdenum hydroxylase [Enterococcus faecalis]